ncbi:beta-galactosidase GalB [Massilia sp. Root335]|uniref:beta-galactosidase GalB n=1 Tax=Massilia sp. Root335 TaxID=1736517 RepID=UPI0007015687|nr:beta-galactosidase GalB [Massilia sp. Root335]KQV49689.1 beta-galactosidase [Massilia sp. Root335]
MTLIPRSLSIIACGVALLCGAAQAADMPVRERLSFDAGWRFAKGDPAGSGQLDDARLKDPATAIPAAQPGFDDAAWRKLDLPHDWGIEGPFKQAYPGETGKLPWWGVGWYRKHFTLPAGDAGRRVYLDIDGAMSHAAVWVNGHYVGGWPYGYASWRVDLTPYAKPGSDNVVAIRLDNPPDSSRWYPGGGIYRNVWLVKTAPVHVAQYGTFVTTPQVTRDAATVAVQTTVESDGQAAQVQVATEIYLLDAAGKRGAAPVARQTASAPAKVVADREAQLTQTLTVPQPRLWSIATPQRYVAVTTVTDNGKVTDVVETPFGIRTAVFDAVRGFILNGKRVPLQGVCMHHDMGALGTAVNVRALERQLELLREMGTNAIRTSHNPPAPELLDLADRMGFVVLDEAFDMWQIPKKPNDYHLLFDEWHEKDLRAQIRRDRSHPSVIAWSIGNEIPEQGKPEGWKLAARLAEIARGEDRTRPVTMADNHVDSAYNGFQNVVDLFGYNYKPGLYGKVHAAAPYLPLFGSETASTISSRGEYFFPVSDDKSKGAANFQVSSYDLTAPPWATTPDAEFKGQDDNPFVAGEFVWTGFDYLGEPTPYNDDASNLLNFTDPAQQARAAQELATMKKIAMPSRSSYFGIIDLAGFKKDRFYLYQARWRPDLPMAHLLPHWNWPERVGQVTPVHLYTSGDEAELFLNGKSLGRKKRGPRDYRLRWDDVVYQPGTLKAVVYKHGKRWAEDTVATTGKPARLLLSADRARLAADGKDLAFVTVTVADKDGHQVPRSHDRITFTLSGPGEIVATDNGDATNLEPFQSHERNAFNGLALAIVKTRAGEGGKLTLTASADGLAPTQVTLDSQPQ